MESLKSEPCHKEAQKTRKRSNINHESHQRLHQSVIFLNAGLEEHSLSKNAHRDRRGSGNRQRLEQHGPARRYQLDVEWNQRHVNLSRYLGLCWPVFDIAA